MSNAAELQRRPKRPRAERTQICCILPQTGQARLTELSMHTKPAPTAASSSPAASSSAQPGNAAPRLQDPSATLQEDMEAALISAQSTPPSHAGNTTTAPKRRAHQSTHRHTQQGECSNAGPCLGQPARLQHHQL